MNRSFTLIKPEWDVIALERVQEACDITKKADVAAVVCQEGLANICLLTSSMTIIRQHIDCPVPRKRKGSVTNYEKVWAQDLNGIPINKRQSFSQMLFLFLRA